MERFHSNQSISANNNKKAVLIYQKRRQIYQALTKPSGFWAWVYHWFVCTVLFMDLLLLSIMTVAEYALWAVVALRVADMIVLIVFGVEFILRLWSAPFNPKYRGTKGIIRFIIAPSSILDLLVIIITAVLLSQQLLFKHRHNKRFDWLRFVQVIKLFRIDMPFKRWRLVWSVIWMQRQQLCIIFHVCIISMMLITFAVYFVEHSTPNTDFTSIPITLWWSIISLLTIGYGDMYPQTAFGKLLAACLFLFSVSLYAVPSGIIGTGIALKVQEQKRHKKKQIRRRLPAALLIQWTWRYFVVTRCNPLTDSFTYPNSEPIQFPVTFRALCHRLNVHQTSTSCSLSPTARSVNSEIDYQSDESDHQEEISLTPKQFILTRLFCLLQFQLARLRFQASNPFGDINDLIDRHQMVHEDVIKRLQIIDNRLVSILRKMNMQ